VDFLFDFKEEKEMFFYAHSTCHSVTRWRIWDP